MRTEPGHSMRDQKLPSVLESFTRISRKGSLKLKSTVSMTSYSMVQKLMCVKLESFVLKARSMLFRMAISSSSASMYDCSLSFGRAFSYHNPIV